MPQTQRDFGGLLTTMQQNEDIFAQVPAGLAHYEPLVTTMQANVDNYRDANSLPSFRLFAWFFVTPGVLLMLIADTGSGRVAGRRPTPGASRQADAGVNEMREDAER